MIMMAISDSLMDYWWAWLVGARGAGRRLHLRPPHRAGPQGLGLAEDQPAAAGPDESQGGHQPQHPHAGHHALQRHPDARCACNWRPKWPATAITRSCGRKLPSRWPSGKQIHESLAGSPLFPPMLVQMISAGEQTGKLGPVLERVSNYYDQEVETSLKAVTSIIEPMMITVMGAVVGTIGLALLLPIFSLSKAAG